MTMQRLTILIVLVCLSLSATAQTFFKPVRPEAVVIPEGVQRRQMTPLQMHTFRLDDLAGMSALLANAPMEYTADARSGRSVLQIPMADGTMEDFAVFRVMAFEPLVYERHPEVRTFAGYALRNPALTLRGSITLRGLKIMVMQPDFGIVYVEPCDAFGQTPYYRVYDRADIPKDILPAGLTRGIAEGTEVLQVSPTERRAVLAQVQERTAAQLMNLKIYRYAVGCTHAYSADNGGTKPLAWASVMEYSNQVSAIYERDVAMRLQLVAASESTVFVDAASDPYPNADAGSIMGTNGIVMNAFIGINNYDIGHAYGRYQGGAALGIAGGITCTSNSKASGCSLGYPQLDYGDNFVNTIGQETGHQCSAGHTWNFCGDNNGRNGGSAFEPGSGSTIMSYGGACGSDDVQNYSDLYFHAGSIDEIQFFYTFLLGEGCGVLQPTTNHRPEVTLPYTNGFFIPINTPFELNGSATDEDNDVISYTWEQMDIGPATPLNMPVGNSPLFRVFPAGDKTNRVFPRMSRVLANQFDITEQLPTYDRDMTFRFSARDNRPGEGGVGWKDVEFRATALAGPFRVEWPNVTVDTWEIGSYVTVRWDVANTFGAPVNCKKVNIRLSTDGGLTWPTILAENVANDGTQSVQVPNLPTNNARIRVDAADNVFFDVSNQNFKIKAPTTPALTVGLSEDGGTICLPNSLDLQVFTTGVLGFSAPVTLDLIDLNPPVGGTFSLSPTDINSGQTSSININFENVNQTGTFGFTVRATVPSTGQVVLIPVTVRTITNDFTTLAMTTPIDGSTSLAQAQTLRWTTAADALNYDVQLATSPSFAPATLVATKTGTSLDNFPIPFLLDKQTDYYWRIRPNNACSPHDWLEPNFFSTLTEICSSADANDLPKNFSAGTVNTIESKIQVNAGTIMSDLNIHLKGYHDDFGDMEATLISPTGTTIELYNDRCEGTSQAFNFTLDSDAPNAFGCIGLTTGITMRPVNSLTAFNGQSASGLWSLRIRDDQAGNGGTLEEFELLFCSSANLNAPFLVNNNVLEVPNGTNAPITGDYLRCSDADNTPEQLIYTLVTIPQNGRLQLLGTELVPGSEFTQADLDAGRIRYYDYGYGTGLDCFRFTVTDGAGSFLGTPAFCIQPLLVDAPNVQAAAPQFRIVPNPANDMIFVTLDAPLAQIAQVQLFDAAGRLVSTNQFPAAQTRLMVPVAELPRGVYFVQLLTSEGIAVKKLSVQ
jgi:subtilisin-like proprotein convertase family protein